MSAFGCISTIISIAILSVVGGFSFFNIIEEDDKGKRISSFIVFIFCAFAVAAYVTCLNTIDNLGGL